MRFQYLGALLAALTMGACQPPPDPGNDAGNNGADACMSETGHICSAPTTNLCSMESCNFRALTLPKCSADGGDYNFYGTEFQQAELTLLVVAAGWCVPCQMEAPMIEELITQGYQGRVRVISVYGQNPDGSTPSPGNCRTWGSNYGLTSTQVYDPNGLTQVYFPNMAFPANILIDKRGRIRYRKYGTSTGLVDLRDAIDAILANP